MKKKAVASIIVLLAVSVLMVSIPPAKANPRFVIAGWDCYDNYGQGIYAVWVYENSTGSWAAVGSSYQHYNNTNEYEWNASVGIQIHYFTWFNSTLTGAVDSDDGKNYQQYSIIVTDYTGATVYSLQSFTYHSVNTVNDPIWFYHYYMTLNFLPDYGETYTVILTFEVFY